MRRREFMAALGGLALTWPLAAYGQQPGRSYRIGYLTGSGRVAVFEAFRRGLRELGYIEGKNIVIERRSSGGNPGRRRAGAAELARLEVDVIVAVGFGDIRAAREATDAIPIVMVTSGDPVASGLVASLARPGGNVTGLATLRPELAAKRLELLKETIPGLSRVAVFLTANEYADYGRTHFQEVLDHSARAIGVTLRYLPIMTSRDIETGFSAAVAARAEAALFRVAGPLLGSWRPWIAELAANSRLPVIYERGSMVHAGGLMSYGVDRLDLYRRAATYVDKILKGAKPAELPIQQPARFKMVINLRAARALGLTIPHSVMLRADEVIE